MMSVVSKCIGKIERWPLVFKDIIEDGFKAIHFTPVQESGGSRFHFSISNFNQVSDEFFENPKSLSKE